MLGFNEKKRFDFNSYLCSFLHHIVVVPISFYRLFFYNFPFSFYSKNILNNLSIEGIELLHCDAAPFSFGYLLSDTLLYAIPEAYRGNKEYLYHHLLGLCLFFAVPYLTSDLSIFCGRILIMESTSIFFTLAYLLRNSGLSNVFFLIQSLEILFAIDFFLVRVINGFDLYRHIIYDLLLFNHQRNEENQSKLWLGRALSILFIPILAMQVYWMIIIIKKSFTRFEKNKI